MTSYILKKSSHFKNHSPSLALMFFILFLSSISPSHPKARLLHCKCGAGPDTQGEIQDLPS